MQHVTKRLIYPTLVALICVCLGAVRDAADYYTTQPGDTLWEIAERYVQDDTATTYEMMRTLFDTNPKAFINNNINLLRIGYTLRIPTQEERRVTLAPLESEDQRTSTSVAEQLAPASDAHLVSPVEQVVSEDVDVTPHLVAGDVAKLQSELALTQEQASRQHAENEALRDRVAALEARVTQLGDIAATPNAAGRDGPAGTQARPLSRTAAWLSLPHAMMVMMSLMIVLGLAAIWYWRRRAMPTTVTTRTEPALTAPPGTEATDPLALDLSDLHVATEGAGDIRGAVAASPDTGLDAETASDTPLAHLMIDVDDLELESSQAEAEPPDWPSSVSISPKADPASSPKAC